MKLVKFSAFAAFICASIVSVPLQAQNIDAVSLSVPYSGVDLSSEEGRAALDQRIAVVVRRVCAYDGSRDLITFQSVRQCRSRSFAEATRQRDVAIANYRDLRTRDAELAARKR